MNEHNEGRILLRICILTETFHPVIGGGETQAQALAAGLIQQGSDVLVLTRHHDATLPRQEIISGIPVYRVPPAGAAHWKKWGLLLSAALALWRLRRQYDLIFVSGFRVVGVTAVLLAKLLGKKVILKADSLGEMSGDFFAGGLARFGLRPGSLPFRAFLGLRNRILRRADRFVAISTVVADELRAHGVSAEQIKRIPNSVDNGRFHPVSEQKKLALRRQLGLPVAAQIVIYTGRLVRYKGLPLLLQVWREVQAQFDRAYLLLVGAGGLDIDNCEAELRDYIATHQLQDSVGLTGNVRNVEQYLQAADIFVFPTENEAFGISLIEAMASGLAVVSTAVGGLDDIVTHNENCLVVEASNRQQLHKAIVTLLTNPNQCRRLAERACEGMQQLFSTERVIHHYQNLFKNSHDQQTI
jgi:glycosyltransferase involved in cell wall biosynthesis